MYMQWLLWSSQDIPTPLHVHTSNSGSDGGEQTEGVHIMYMQWVLCQDVPTPLHIHTL